MVARSENQGQPRIDTTDFLLSKQAKGLTQKVFLTRYNFVYADRGTVNQVGKIAPRQIKNASSEINSIAQQRINQVISHGGKEIQRVLSKILRGAIGDVYQTPFRLLGKFGRQQLQKIKNKEHRKKNIYSFS